MHRLLWLSVSMAANVEIHDALKRQAIDAKVQRIADQPSLLDSFAKHIHNWVGAEPDTTQIHYPSLVSRVEPKNVSATSGLDCGYPKNSGSCSSLGACETTDNPSSCCLLSTAYVCLPCMYLFGYNCESFSSDCMGGCETCATGFTLAEMGVCVNTTEFIVVTVTTPPETETPSPVTEAPVTEAPVTEAPVTEAPVVTEAPNVTEVPVNTTNATSALDPNAAAAMAPAGIIGFAVLGILVGTLCLAVSLYYGRSYFGKKEKEETGEDWEEDEVYGEDESYPSSDAPY